MKLHELKIKHEYLVEITLGNKMFELRKNDRNYQVGDLIHFIDVGRIEPTSEDLCGIECCCIDENTLYRITYILKDVPEYGLDKDYCILGIKKVEIR